MLKFHWQSFGGNETLQISQIKTPKQVLHYFIGNKIQSFENDLSHILFHNVT